ncbi:MAG: sensor histidine kinase [Acidimicrobiales bacterium]
MKDDRQGPVESAMQPGSKRRKQSLRVQILVSTLLVGLIPIVLLALVTTFGLRGLASTADAGLSSTRQSIASETVTAALIDDADEAGREVDRVLAERIGDVVGWARQPFVDDPGYLEREVQQQRDFVDLVYYGQQVEEPWWLDAFASGVWVGPATTLGPNQPMVIPIAVHVTDEAGAPTGVLRGNLSIVALHRVVDRLAIDGKQLTVVAEDGQLLAETSTGHDPTRIANGAQSPVELSPGVVRALSSDRGFLDESGTLYGFSTTTSSATDLVVGPDPAVPSSQWHVVVSKSSADAFAALEGLDGLSRDLRDVRGELAAVTVTVLVVSFLACLIAAHIMARKLVMPVRHLTRRAQLLADNDLIAAEALPDDPDLDVASLEDHSIDINAGNELDELAASFDSVHRTAVHMTHEQAHLREITAEMFANLGRRNQSLVKRQLRFIEELEHSEEDPDRLASLFKLDHLATRMRRNAESLLVIAGHRGNSRRSNPVHIGLVTQAALGEVENFERVDISEVEPAAIMGRAVAGLAHVLAELIENALSFSPPETTVRIVGEHGAAHYSLSVIDRGIGLLPDELEAVNERLAIGADSELTSSKQLGHLVVAKLASRHGFRVRLVESAAGGVAARVEIPNTLIQPATLGPTVLSERPYDESAKGLQTSPTMGPATKLPPASVPQPTSGETVPEHWAPPTVPEPVPPLPVPPLPVSPLPVPPLPVPPLPVPTSSATAMAAPPLLSTAPLAEGGAPERPMRRREDQQQDRPEPSSTSGSGAPRYKGSLSATATSQLSSVPRRESRRPKPTTKTAATSIGDGADTEGRPKAKRAVATTDSDQQVVDEATDVRNRWNQFRSGQESAAARGSGDATAAANTKHDNRGSDDV